MRQRLSSSRQLNSFKQVSSVQELAFVLTDTLLLPCIDPTNEASPVSPDDCSYSKVGLEAVDKRLVHYDLLSKCPACVKGGRSCLYFWERAMPHCCQWLEQHIDWTLSLELGGRLNIGPYLDVLGRSTRYICWTDVCCKQSGLLRAACLLQSNACKSPAFVCQGL